MLLTSDSSDHVAAIRAVGSPRQGTGGGTVAPVVQLGCQKRKQEEFAEAAVVGRGFGLGPRRGRKIGPGGTGERLGE